ncbi:asparaginase domain-containing protein, partial [Salmonella enterica]|uniref:asparaginase domain-containing protein n=1 Tax=Salmonella enterica TaxID=28901 RepID=UPI00398C47A9
VDKKSDKRCGRVEKKDHVMDGRDVTKTNTTDVGTFKAVNYGPLGYIHNGKIDYQRTPARKHTTSTPFDVSKLTALPKVGIVYNYSNPSYLRAKALVYAGYYGAGVSGAGNCNLHHTVFTHTATSSSH